MTRNLFIALMLAGSASALAGDMLTDGIDAYQSGRYRDAYALLYPEARSGNAEAKYLVGRILDAGLGGETDPDKALRMLIGAARLGHVDARFLVEQTKGCVAEQTCRDGEALEIWTCGGRKVHMVPPSGVTCNAMVGNQERIGDLIERRKPVDRYFGDPLPGGKSAGRFGSAAECAAWAAAAPSNEQRRCHQGL
jgi:TPR repeat protein